MKLSGGVPLAVMSMSSPIGTVEARRKHRQEPLCEYFTTGFAFKACTLIGDRDIERHSTAPLPLCDLVWILPLLTTLFSDAG